MIIACPQCGTKYKLADHRIRPTGNKVRCSSCKFVFHCPPPSTTTSGGREENSSGFEKAEPNTAKGNESGSPFPEQPRKRRRPLLLLLLLLLVAILGAVYLYYPRLKTSVPFLSDTSSPTDLLRKAENPENSLSSIAFTEVRQYMVDNENIGQLLVIEGNAVNKSNDPVEMIKVQAEIYNDKDQELQSKNFYCGNTISLFQLQILDHKEMDAALNSKVGVLTNNSNIPPGERVSFMTVFYNPPPEMAEFSLKVIQANPLSQG